MTGTAFREEYDESYTDSLIEKLIVLGAKNIILTGVSYRPDRTGVLVVSDGNKRYYEHRKIAKGCHGTGDVYASAFVGLLLSGRDPFDAACIAADLTVKCIENTQEDSSHWYGVKFETVLPDLIGCISR